MSESAQKPGRSKQDYCTPPAFLAAVERRWGELHHDLACTEENAVAGFLAADTLAIDWPRAGRLWLNPPFGDIATWAAKCATWEPVSVHARIFLLTPASIGTNWFAEHVHGRAMVLGVRPRLTFQGADAPYPKDLMLSIFGAVPGFGVWDWSAEPAISACVAFGDRWEP